MMLREKELPFRRFCSNRQIVLLSGFVTFYYFSDGLEHRIVSKCFIHRLRNSFDVCGILVLIVVIRQFCILKQAVNRS